MRQWLLHGDNLETMVLEGCMLVVAAVSFWFGRVWTIHRIIKGARANPKVLYDWAEQIRADELGAAESPRGD